MTWILPWKNVEILEVKDYNGGEMKDNTRLSNIYKKTINCYSYCHVIFLLKIK